MRVLWLQFRNVVEALAVEEAILRGRLENGSPDTLCFWRGKKSVVVGCDINRDKVDFRLCNDLGIPVYRRQTGGGAIYQDEGNLNYSLIAPLGVFQGKDAHDAGHLIDFLVAKAISKMNLNATATGGGTICVRGRKVAGSAQFVLWGYLLHHGVVAVNTNLDLLQKIISVNKIPVTTLERELGEVIEIERVAAQICKEFAAGLNTTVFQGKLKEREEHMAQRLLEEKYLTLEWNRCYNAKN